MAPVNVVKHFQYLVVGGGSGGIASARRAAEFGVSVGLIEKQALGGTCVSMFLQHHENLYKWFSVDKLKIHLQPIKDTPTIRQLILKPGYFELSNYNLKLLPLP